jgi:4-alpha-glucanotransferase
MRVARCSGLLLHPTSLPSKYGIGTLGEEACRFVDFLADSGQSLWQLLPLGPTGYGNSPYQCVSAFAGNPLVIDLDLLAGRLGLGREELGPCPEHRVGRIEYGSLIASRDALFRRAHEEFRRRSDPALRAELARFGEQNAGWLENYALFMALKERFGGACWAQWPEAARFRQPEALASWRTELADAVERHRFLQWAFFDQWTRLRAYASERNVRVIGDLPLYVAYDSAEVWSEPDGFLLDGDRNPLSVAGVPPDYFSPTGQLWGNPLYDWDRMRGTGFRWWLDRFRANLRWYDFVRFDHFQGLCTYWAVPFGERTAARGEWRKAPGHDLLSALCAEAGELPILAEDLGVLTDEVVALRERFNLPGMRVLQYAFDPSEVNDHRPHAYARRCAAYTGTHDNDTVAGWYANSHSDVRNAARDYLHATGATIALAFVRAVWASVADVAIAPLQDVLGLESDARMNTPGTDSGNWEWRFEPGSLTPRLARDLRRLTKMYGRLAPNG